MRSRTRRACPHKRPAFRASGKTSARIVSAMSFGLVRLPLILMIGACFMPNRRALTSSARRRISSSMGSPIRQACVSGSRNVAAARRAGSEGIRSWIARYPPEVVVPSLRRPCYRRLNAAHPGRPECHQYCSLPRSQSCRSRVLSQGMHLERSFSWGETPFRP
jgi:hypothetical protein